jgi:hypothetical protein
MYELSAIQRSYLNLRGVSGIVSPAGGLGGLSENSESFATRSLTARDFALTTAFQRLRLADGLPVGIGFNLFRLNALAFMVEAAWPDPHRDLAEALNRNW